MIGRGKDVMIKLHYTTLFKVAIMTGDKSNCFRREKNPCHWIRNNKVVFMVLLLPFCFSAWIIVCYYILINMLPGMATIIAFFKLRLKACEVLIVHPKLFVTTSVFYNAAHATSKYEKYLAKHTQGECIILISEKFQVSRFWIVLCCMRWSHFELHFAW